MAPSPRVCLIGTGLMLALTGCAGLPGVTPEDHFRAYRYETAFDGFKQRVDKAERDKHRDVALYNCGCASAALNAGAISQAQHRLFHSALVMTNFELSRQRGDEATLAPWVQAGAKLFQGEGYERAMVDLLHGISLYAMGDYGNARVACDRAILADRLGSGRTYAERHGDKTTSAFKASMVAAYYFRGKAYLRLGREELARLSFDEAARRSASVKEAVQKDLLPERAKVASGGADAAVTDRPGDDDYPYDGSYLLMARHRAAKEAEYLRAFPPPDRPAYLDLAANRANNLTVAVAVGDAPTKVPAGAYNQFDYPVRRPEATRYFILAKQLEEQGSWGRDGFIQGHLRKWDAEPCMTPTEPVRIEVLCDDAFVGEMVPAADTYVEAMTRHVPLALIKAQQHKADMEGLGKFIEEWAPSYAAYVGTLMQAVTQEQADLRQWSVLPERVYLFNGRVPAGKHTITLVFYDRENRPRWDMEQNWYRVPFDDRQERVLYWRCGAGRHSHAVPKPARLTRIVEQKETEKTP